MPKLIDYPRTSYTGAWEVAEVVDDTGGKCALETCARKLNRKVSGSFKAIIGSAVKFGLLTSKREILTTTTLFRRIKHAYDKQEELLFHREAFLTPPLFTQLCRKFRSRELPVAMLDVLLIREFGVEEINAQSVAKAFTDGAHMVGILDEHNTVADIDQLATQQAPRRELANPTPAANVFRHTAVAANLPEENDIENKLATPAPMANNNAVTGGRGENAGLPLPANKPAPTATTDAIASLFGLPATNERSPTPVAKTATAIIPTASNLPVREHKLTDSSADSTTALEVVTTSNNIPSLLFRLQLNGPGITTTLEVTDADDLSLVRALLDKIERQLLKQNSLNN